MFRSMIWRGHVMHARLSPAKHAFRYPVYFFSLDVDELPELDRRIPWFSYNRRNLTALFDRDYLRGQGSLRDKLLRELKDKPYVRQIERIELVTCLRYLNYAFNPVSFYACRDQAERLVCVVAEVNNTFNERHLYILDESNERDTEDPGQWVAYAAPKTFHVSPFNDVQGEYRFRFPRNWKMSPLKIGVDLWKDGAKVMVTEWTGRRGSPLRAAAMLGGLLRYPLSALLTMPRILWQAARLYVEKGLSIYMKPEPASVQTFRVAQPTLRTRIAMRFVLRFFARFRIGLLVIQLPSGETLRYGDPSLTADESRGFVSGSSTSASFRHASIRITDERFFRRIVSDGDIGFGESYMAGEWDTPDLTGLLELFIDNREFADDNHTLAAGILKWTNAIRHALRANSRSGSRDNIKAHYDLSNEMYQQFLDPTMTYSSAYFADSANTLEQAQLNKLDRMIRLAQISESDHVLEIGSGWGSFAIRAASTTGCRVTTITLSEQQLREARRRVEKAGLSDLVEVVFCDYRDMTGQFDKIVSIEMFEAVGHEYYGTFFSTCDRLLKPDGLLAMQVITIADQRYDTYRKSTDWIQKYIFPGGLCPSLTAFSSALTKHSRFTIETFSNIGVHYGKTLRLWREQFESNRNKISALGFDETFVRMWRYYLAYCEAGFNTRQLGTLQLLMTRPNNPALPKAP